MMTHRTKSAVTPDMSLKITENCFLRTGYNGSHVLFPKTEEVNLGKVKSNS